MATPADTGRHAPLDFVTLHPVAFTCLLCLAWLIPGLVGHDPWKPDEAYSFGLVYHMLQTGDWVVPTLAGEPFMEKPPLFYITAALFAKGFGWLLPLHDAGRLASGFYMALTFLLVGLTARELHGERKGWLAVLILLGSVGLIERAHQLLTDVSQLTGFALALYGLALSVRRPVLGGVWLGAGVGVAFMSKGLLAPGCFGLLCLALPAIFPIWRTRNYVTTLAIAALAIAPFLLVWPWLLYQRSPELFQEWLWTNNFGRFMGRNQLGPKSVPGQYLGILIWYAMPAWPLAAWAVWSKRRELRDTPGLHLPLTAFLVIFTVLSVSRDARDLYAMPTLVPLALLAVPGLLTLRRGASNALLWFSVLFFAFFLLVGWFYWIALDSELPARLHRHLLRMQPGYTPSFSWMEFGLGLLYTAGWVYILMRTRRTPERPIVFWATGATMVWGLLLILFVDYADVGKSYRSMTLAIQAALPKKYDCISSYNLGEPQRALLQYFAGIVTYRETEPSRKRECHVLLVQGFRNYILMPNPDAHWRKIWEGARPGDEKELFQLYERK
jgi:4-amino-4-deoxy-L-arabinose transferase-like glycosyltransferase